MITAILPKKRTLPKFELEIDLTVNVFVEHYPVTNRLFVCQDFKKEIAAEGSIKQDDAERLFHILQEDYPNGYINITKMKENLHNDNKEMVITDIMNDCNMPRNIAEETVNLFIKYPKLCNDQRFGDNGFTELQGLHFIYTDEYGNEYPCEVKRVQ